MLIDFVKFYFCTCRTTTVVFLVMYLLRGVSGVLDAWAELYLMRGRSCTCCTDRHVLVAWADLYLLCGAKCTCYTGKFVLAARAKLYLLHDRAVLIASGKAVLYMFYSARSLNMLHETETYSHTCTFERVAMLQRGGFTYVVLTAEPRVRNVYGSGLFLYGHVSS
jgi:hypothetical protein